MPPSSRPLNGLSTEEVRRRLARGEVNRVVLPTSRPVVDIFKGNILTLFNGVLAGAVILLLLVGEWRDAFLTGILVLFSVSVSTAQEMRAKIRLERIALLGRAPVRVIRDGRSLAIDPSEVVLGDYLELSRGEPVVVDGSLVQSSGLEVNESLLTGESEPVTKREGDEVRSGSYCVAGSGVYVAQRVGMASYAQGLAAAARAYSYTRTPLQRSLSRVLSVLLVAVLVVSAIQAAVFLFKGVPLIDAVRASAVLATLVPQGLLLMSTVAYSVGAVRLGGMGVLVQQLNAIESLSHADVLCIDKTGTLTTGRMRLAELRPISGQRAEVERLLGVFAASFPERGAILGIISSSIPSEPCPVVAWVPFSSERGWSMLTLAAPCQPGTFLMGAPERLLAAADDASRVAHVSREQESAGRRVLLFARAGGIVTQGEGASPVGLPAARLQPIALIALEEELRPGAGPLLEALEREGISVKVISGDSPKTLLAVARRAGFAREGDRALSGEELETLPLGEWPALVEPASLFGRVKPLGKRDLVRTLVEAGHYVAMVGDGVNDILAMKESNVSIAMGSGSAATRTAADIILLEDSLEALVAGIMEGRRIVNSMLLLVKLFLIRDVSALELIVVAGLAGAHFPFLPPQAALVALLTVGIPAIAVVAWSEPGPRGQGDLSGLARVVLEIGTTYGLALWSVYALAILGLGADVARTRTMVATAAVLSGAVVLITFRHPLDAPIDQLLADGRFCGLALGMVASYAAGLYWPTWRSYFELSAMAPVDWLVTVPVVFGWFALLRCLARWPATRHLLR